MRLRIPANTARGNAASASWGQMEDGIAGVAHQPGAGLHQPLA